MTVRTVDVGSADELLSSGRAVVNVAPGTDILLVRTRRAVIAIPNACPHMGLPLSDARVRGRYLECAHHGRRFDLGGGCGLLGRPAGPPLTRYKARIEDGRVLVDFPPAPVAALPGGA